MNILKTSSGVPRKYLICPLRNLITDGKKEQLISNLVMVVLNKVYVGHCDVKYNQDRDRLRI